MIEALDNVVRYGRALGFNVRERTILVEGNTDVRLFELASRLEYEATGNELVDSRLAICSPGSGDLGGTSGVVRELVSLRAHARLCLLPNGKARYRFVGLFDTDQAGRQAVKMAQYLDTSILEYKDIFRLHPVMPPGTNLDPKSLKLAFEKANSSYSGVQWEAEDLLPRSLIDAFLEECPSAVTRTIELGDDKVHRDFTQDGKARFHRFVSENALRSDVADVVQVLKAMRSYLGLPLPS
jgi:hypothetical protein